MATKASMTAGLASTGSKDTAEAAHYNILQVGDYIENRLGRVLREHGLTFSQYQVLRVLDAAGSALPALTIGERMTQLVPAITGLVTRLEDQGLVRRRADKEDRRVTQVDLTSKGRSLMKKLEKPVLDLHRALGKDLSDNELKQLSKLLEKAWLGMQSVS